jgi:putative SOS response-associated peptidase YedK
MRNLYNVTTTQEAIRALSKAMRDLLGNLEPSLDVCHPNLPGPVVRTASGGQREAVNLLWGMPTPTDPYDSWTNRHSVIGVT